MAIAQQADAMLGSTPLRCIAGRRFVQPEDAAVVCRSGVQQRPAVGFKQRVNASDPLSTGSYAKTLTFTLSTHAPVVGLQDAGPATGSASNPPLQKRGDGSTTR